MWLIIAAAERGLYLSPWAHEEEKVGGGGSHKFNGKSIIVENRRGSAPAPLA